MGKVDALSIATVKLMLYNVKQHRQTNGKAPVNIIK